MMDLAKAVPVLLVAVPLSTAAVLALMPDRRAAGWVNLVAALLTLVLALVLPSLVAPAAFPAATAPGAWLRADPLAASMALLTAFVGATTAWYSRHFAEVEWVLGRLDPIRTRLFHSGCQALQGFVLLALLAGSPSIAWLAMLAATLVMVLAIALIPGTQETATAAARRHLPLAGGSLALALLGTTMLLLADAGREMQTPLASMGFVLLLVGYGTLAGLAPCHVWLSGSYAAGPAPISALLSPGLANAALALLLRARSTVAGTPTFAGGNGGLLEPAGLLALFGALSAVAGAFMLWRRPGGCDALRWFAGCAVLQAGLAAVAFALGGPATIAGILVVAGGTLARTAAAQCLIRAAQRRGGSGEGDGRELDSLAGLLSRRDGSGRGGLGYALLLSLVALAGLPPACLFTGEILLVMDAARHSPALAAVLVASMLIAGWALLACGVRLVLGPPKQGAGEARALAAPQSPPLPAGRRWDLAGAWAHLAILLLLGLLLPAPIATWLHQVAASLVR